MHYLKSMVSQLVKLLFIKSYSDMGAHQRSFVITRHLMFTGNFLGFANPWGYKQHQLQLATPKQMALLKQK